jgi:RNase H-like domain found in reverse transcriptase
VGGPRRNCQLSLTPKWGPAHQRYFDQLKQHLADQTKLAFPKPDYEICLCTDASETHWSGVLTQVRKTDRHLPIEEQRHEPLGFLSGPFKDPLASWATVEKEAYSIVESMIRFEHIVGGHHVSLYTDHSHLVYIFDPYGQNPGIARHTASKLMRWAVKLSSFRYTIEEIAGDVNKFADLLTRWAVRPRSTISRLARLVTAPISPSTFSKYDWPDHDSLKNAQLAAVNPVPQECTADSEGLARYQSQAVWIPDGDKTLQLRLLIAAHTGPGGHRGITTTEQAMNGFVQWTSMLKDLASL